MLHPSQWQDISCLALFAQILTIQPTNFPYYNIVTRLLGLHVICQIKKEKKKKKKLSDTTRLCLGRLHYIPLFFFPLSPRLVESFSHLHLASFSVFHFPRSPRDIGGYMYLLTHTWAQVAFFLLSLPAVMYLFCTDTPLRSKWERKNELFSKPEWKGTAGQRGGLNWCAAHGGRRLGGDSSGIYALWGLFFFFFFVLSLSLVTVILALSYYCSGPSVGCRSRD